MPFSQYPQTPSPPGMTLTYQDNSAVLHADASTVLRIPPPSDVFPTDRYTIVASNGTGSGPRSVLLNLTRSQMRRLALNILDAIG